MFFLKQYGARRTGTNFLRLLITKNIENVSVLIHVLGDKHSPPVDLNSLWLQCANASAPALEFVRRATFAFPAETTSRHCANQATHLAALATDLACASHQKRLGFLISIKDPYAWAVSIARYHQWFPTGSVHATQEPYVAERLRHQCWELNRCYQLWFEHHSRSEAKSMIVRYEDLLNNPAEFLQLFCQKFELVQGHNEILVPQKIVLPTHWDHVETNLHWTNFQPEIYLRKRFLDLLTPRLKDVVTHEIDWALMRQFGYTAESL
jgi:hypothetical protein